MLTEDQVDDMLKDSIKVLFVPLLSFAFMWGVFDQRSSHATVEINDLKERVEKYHDQYIEHRMQYQKQSIELVKSLESLTKEMNTLAVEMNRIRNAD